MEISIAAEKITHISGLPISNSMIMTWIAGVILVVSSFFATRRLSLVPRGIQNFFETIIEFLFNTIDEVLGDREQTKKYFPLLATIFIFILTNNWLGLLPGVGTVSIHEGEKLVPLLRSGNADLNMTLALAIIAVLAVQIFGIAAIGFAKNTRKYITFKNPIATFVGFLELISEVSRMISFAFRLFGNIFAGEVLLTVIAMIIPYVVPLPFMGLELFVGAIQALVFTMLTLVFIKTAITPHEAH